MKPLRTVSLALLWLAASAPAPLPAQPIELPSIGDPSGEAISPIQERRLGEALMRNLRRQGRLIEDPEITEYIQSLGYRLVAASDHPSQTFSFFVVRDDEINAFAAPGGFIGAHAGLLLAAESESEVAAVLAHEIAHITQRHMARTIEAARKLTLPAAAALLAAVLLGSQDSQLGEAALAAGLAGSAQYQLNFTRANEREADSIGIRILAHAGFDPHSMAAFFERLQRASRYYDNQLPEFLSTHPVTVARISDARSRANRFPPPSRPDSLSYHLARAKLRVIMAQNPRELVERLAKSLAAGRYANEQSARYEYVLALNAAGRPSEARRQLRRLLDSDPERIAYRLAQASVEMALGNHSRALKVYEKTLRLYPGNHPLTVSYAEALLKAGKARKARLLLRDHLRRHGDDPQVHRLYARACRAAGFPAEAHRAMAEYYYLTGQTEVAIEQLGLALHLPDLDFYETSRMEARLRQWQEELREQQAE